MSVSGVAMQTIFRAPATTAHANGGQRAYVCVGGCNANHFPGSSNNGPCKCRAGVRMSVSLCLCVRGCNANHFRASATTARAVAGGVRCLCLCVGGCNANHFPGFSNNGPGNGGRRAYVCVSVSGAAMQTILTRSQHLVGFFQQHLTRERNLY